MTRHEDHQATGRRSPSVAADQRLSGHVTDDLLLTAGRGDLIAFADLYDRTAVAVYRLLRGVLGDSAAAERAAERVYLQVWQMAPSYDPDRRSAYSLLMLTAGRELAMSLSGGWSNSG